MSINNTKFLIIGGASKSGTTAIYYYLKKNPAFFLPEKKELHYFSREYLENKKSGKGDGYVLEEVPRTMEDYLGFYKKIKDGVVPVDISPSYLFYSKVSREIKTHVKNPYVVFILRNPADKIFSQYIHLVGEGRETLSFSDALADEERRKKAGYLDMWLYQESGYYADSIEEYYSTLGRDKVKIFYYDEFLESPKDVLKEICKFVGVSPDFEFVEMSGVNKSGKPKSLLLAKLLAPNKLTYFARRVFPKKFGRAARKIFKDFNNGSKPKLDPDLRVRLLNEYREDIKRVEGFVGRSSGWI
ncbi:MAG: sulfotransferase [Porticoccaceae bacterium]